MISIIVGTWCQGLQHYRMHACGLNAVKPCQRCAMVLATEPRNGLLTAPYTSLLPLSTAAVLDADMPFAWLTCHSKGCNACVVRMHTLHRPSMRSLCHASPFVQTRACITAAAAAFLCWQLSRCWLYHGNILQYGVTWEDRHMHEPKGGLVHLVWCACFSVIAWLSWLYICSQKL